MFIFRKLKIWKQMKTWPQITKIKNSKNPLYELNEFKFEFCTRIKHITQQ